MGPTRRHAGSKQETTREPYTRHPGNHTQEPREQTMRYPGSKQEAHTTPTTPPTSPSEGGIDKSTQTTDPVTGAKARPWTRSHNLGKGEDKESTSTPKTKPVWEKAKVMD